MRKHASTTKAGSRRGAALATIGALAVASLTLVGPPAGAAAPDNDSWKSPTEVTSLPFEDTVDTTEATADRVVPAGMSRYSEHSVWYRLVLPEDSDLLLATQTRRYFHKLVVYQADSETQRPDQWSLVAAKRGYDPGFLMSAQSDTVYFVGIGGYRSRPGSTVDLQIRQPAAVAVTLEGIGEYSPVDGSARLHGTITTDQPVSIYLRSGLRQLVGERVVSGYSDKTLSLQPGEKSWAMRITGDYAFQVGEARVIRDTIRVFDMGVRVDTLHFGRETVTLQ